MAIYLPRVGVVVCLLFIGAAAQGNSTLYPPGWNKLAGASMSSAHVTADCKAELLNPQTLGQSSSLSRAVGQKQIESLIQSV